MIKLLNLLIEGGWASKLTQDTKLTPDVVQECVSLYNKFVEDFNKHLKTKQLPEVEAGKAVGSSAYWEKDLKENPDKEYGDVDIMFYIPRLEGTTDNKNKTIYSEEIKSFLENNDKVQTENGTNLIFKLSDGKYAQVDLVNGYSENKEWAAGRMTPERGVKGAIGGYLYSSLAEVLNFSIGTHGVQMKLKGGAPVKFTTAKADKVETVSKDIRRFGLDICKYYYQLITGKDPKNMQVSDSLSKNSGMDPENIKNSDIVKMTKGISDTLELNSLFGKGALTNIKDSSDFISKITDIYKQKMTAAINDPKFNKAEGPEGERKAKEAKEKLQTGLNQILQYLSV